MHLPKAAALTRLANVPRAVTSFCGALLLLAAIAGFSWFLLSRTITPPTARQVALRYGILWPPIKPEPVETYTFLIVLLCAAPVLCAAVYVSRRETKGSFHLGIVLLTIIGALVWIYRMDWPSIVPPQPALLLIAAVHKYPFGFLSCAIVSGIVFALEDWRSEQRQKLYFTVTMAALILAGLSRVVLMNNSDVLVNYPHYVAFIYPIVQDWLGRGILLNQKSLYGLYPIFLRPLWHLTGGPTTAAVCLVMAALLFFVHSAFVAFIVRFSKHKGLAILVALFAIVFTLFFYPFWPGETYFQHFPVRMVFPAIACVCMCLRAKSIRPPYLSWAVLSFGWFWNFEGAMTAVLMFAVFELARRYRRPDQDLYQLAREQAGLALAGLILAGLVMSIYYLRRFGSVPAWTEEVRILPMYSQGLWAEPMPMWGAWIVHTVIYLASIFVGLRAVADPSRDSTRERNAALLAITTMGVVFLRYYQGRSMPLQLVYVSMPAVLCVGMLLDSKLSQLRSGGFIPVRLLRLAIGAPLFGALVVYFANDPVPNREWSAFAAKDPHPLDMTVDRIGADFEKVKRRSTDEIFVLTPYAHLFQLKAGKPNPVPAIGMCELWFQDDMDAVVAALHDPNTRMAVFDSNQVCYLPMDTVPAIAPILKSEFKRISMAASCSAVSYRAYVRQDGAEDLEQPTDRPDLALGKQASQSSAFGETTAAAAVDGNTDGRYEKHSVTHTARNRNAWWEVDLGSSMSIDSVVVWNRTDCCSDRLKKFWVFISETPFSPTDSPETLKKRPAVQSHYELQSPCPDQRVAIDGFKGRYVRVQLAGEDFLSLAEVQVFGTR